MVVNPRPSSVTSEKMMIGSTESIDSAIRDWEGSLSVATAGHICLNEEEVISHVMNSSMYTLPSDQPNQMLTYLYEGGGGEGLNLASIWSIFSFKKKPPPTFKTSKVTTRIDPNRPAQPGLVRVVDKDKFSAEQIRHTNLARDENLDSMFRALGSINQGRHGLRHGFMDIDSKRVKDNLTKKYWLGSDDPDVKATVTMLRKNKVQDHEITGVLKKISDIEYVRIRNAKLGEVLQGANRDHPGVAAVYKRYQEYPSSKAEIKVDTWKANKLGRYQLVIKVKFPGAN